MEVAVRLLDETVGDEDLRRGVEAIEADPRDTDGLRRALAACYVIVLG